MAGEAFAKHLRYGNPDAIHYNVRENGIVTKKAAYIAIVTDLECKKDVLGIWLGATESSKYWLNVFTGFKNRRVKDILIASVDGLSGFVESIHTAFPKTEAQHCIIHQIRASTRYVAECFLVNIGSSYFQGYAVGEYIGQFCA